jgi:hypothetical protein
MPEKPRLQDGRSPAAIDRRCYIVPTYVSPVHSIMLINSRPAREADPRADDEKSRRNSKSEEILLDVSNDLSSGRPSSLPSFILTYCSEGANKRSSRDRDSGEQET